MKSVQLTFAMLVLLITAGCHRQASNSSAATAPTKANAQDESGLGHDPHAMTAIDVATGDLAGFATYAGGRTYAPPPSHTAGVPAATAALPTLPVASVATSDEAVGEQSSAVPLLTPSAPQTSGQTAQPTGSTAQTAP